ncbi:MAG: hypothetical protein SCALA702_08440 [Melioribacteraceae bacterium]|nr:MAG: hypothetical protein SCALA702_08440 [Melioribacteraceae bacterium]
MRNILRAIFIIALFSLSSTSIFAQTFDGVWECQYATYDDGTNGTGLNTIDVGAVSEDEFVALINASSKGAYYLVAYRDADSASGRISDIPYNQTLYQTVWASGFDQVNMEDPNAVAVNKTDGKIFVANNDVERNILVFQMGTDDYESAEYRLPTAADYIWAIDVDNDGHVFVTVIDTANNTSSIRVYDNFANEPSWLDPQLTAPTVLHEIQVPGEGEARGIAVNADGTEIWVSNFDARTIHKFVGDVTSGYQEDPNFSYYNEAMVNDTTWSPDTVYAGPMGLSYLQDNNLLFMAHDVSFRGNVGYTYGKIFTINPFTAENLDTTDVYMWNYLQNDSSAYRIQVDSPGTASGYVSVYNLDFDENGNFYSQSYYGWAAEKWAYTGTLPVITSIEKDENSIPTEFSLTQNYPNPFNPTTTVEFSITETANVTMSLYSVTGELISHMINNREYKPGVYKVTINGSNLASGVYIYSVQAGTQKISKKMTLMK